MSAIGGSRPGGTARRFQGALRPERAHSGPAGPGTLSQVIAHASLPPQLSNLFMPTTDQLGPLWLLEPTSVGPRREPGTFSVAHPTTMAAGVHGPAQHAVGALAKPPGALPGGATWRPAVAARRCGRRDARCGGQCARAHTTVGACARSSARSERAIGSAWSGAARVHWRRYRRRSPPPRVAAAAHHVRSTDARHASQLAAPRSLRRRALMPMAASGAAGAARHGAACFTLEAPTEPSVARRRDALRRVAAPSRTGCG
mmetsp:Transcript_86530/g.259618  ORF Transcript_86530/g.259618 Transcript_86530/m.259618 type:complete len:258 (+) Transcript_86530:256-1029(+)